MIEESESLIVFAITVDGITVKKRRRIDQKCGRTIRLAVKGLCVIGSAAPIDVKVVDRRIPKIFCFRLPITRCDEKRVNADPFQSFRESSGDISKSAGLGVWNRFGRDNGYA